MSPEDYKKILKHLKNQPPPITEEIEACNHMTLNKFIPDGIVYQCDKCKTIFEIFGAASYRPDVFLTHALQIAEAIKAQNDQKEEV